MTGAGSLTVGRTLSADQRAFYRSNGYLLVRQVAPASFLEGVQRHLEAFVEDRITVWHRAALISERYPDLEFDSRFYAAWLAAGSPPAVVTPDDQISFTRTIADLVREEWLVALVSELTGAEGLTAVDSCFYRARLPGDPSTSLPWHQDAACLAEISGVDFITAWIPLVDVSAHNSCLAVSRVGEEQEMLRHEWSERFGYYYMHASAVERLTETRAIPMRRGDVLLLSPFLPHRPLDNTSAGIRWSVDFRYSPS